MDTSEPDPILHDNSFPGLWLILFVVFAIIFVWGLWLYSSIQSCPIAWGSFDALNSLFSGLALAGVVTAILLQRQELILQRAELRSTRAELSRSAKAQSELSRYSLRESTLRVIDSYLRLLETTARNWGETRKNISSTGMSWTLSLKEDVKAPVGNWRIIKISGPHIDAAIDAVRWIQNEIDDLELKLTCLAMIKAALNENLLNFFLRLNEPDWREWVNQAARGTKETTDFVESTDVGEMDLRLQQWKGSAGRLDELIVETRAKIGAQQTNRAEQ